SNFEGILSHHTAWPGPPGISLISLRRNDNSTAFLSHWLTRQVPSLARSATRAAPRSNRSSACSTASRPAPLVPGPTSSRRSKAGLVVGVGRGEDMGGSRAGVWWGLVVGSARIGGPPAVNRNR